MLDERIAISGWRVGPLSALSACIALYAGLALALAPSRFLPVLGYYLSQIAVLPLLVIIGLPLFALALAPAAPAAFILSTLRRGAVPAFLAVLVFCVGVSGFTTFKLMIPQIVPFYADPFFAELDRVLHFGDPGLFTHRLVPQWAEFGLAYIYGKIWLLQWFGLLLVVALMPEGALRTRYFWANALTTLLCGTVLAILLSSVGPIFYEEFYGSDRFAPLLALAAGTAAGEYLGDVSAYLLASYRTGSAAPGTGISAMPSMHVALATLNALFLSRIDWRLGLFGWGFALVILFGSVYLTWHYAIDGYLSMAVAGAIWALTGRVFEQRR